MYIRDEQSHLTVQKLGRYEIYTTHTKNVWTLILYSLYLYRKQMVSSQWICFFTVLKALFFLNILYYIVMTMI